MEDIAKGHLPSVVADRLVDTPENVITDGLLGGFVDGLLWEADPHIVRRWGDHLFLQLHGLISNSLLLAKFLKSWTAPSE